MEFPYEFPGSLKKVVGSMKSPNWIQLAIYKWHFSCQLGDYISLIPPFFREPETAIDQM